MDQFIAYLAGFMTPITLLFVYALIIAGDNKDD